MFHVLNFYLCVLACYIHVGVQVCCISEVCMSSYGCDAAEYVEVSLVRTDILQIILLLKAYHTNICNEMLKLCASIMDTLVVSCHE